MMKFSGVTWVGVVLTQLRPLGDFCFGMMGMRLGWGQIRLVSPDVVCV